MSLFISVTVRGCLIDTRASPNILTLKTLQNTNVSPDQLTPTNMTISGHDKTRRAVMGMIMLDIKCGPVNVPVKFCVIDSLSWYNMILVRLWLDDLKAVSSSRHKCLKFPYRWQVVKIPGDEVSHEDVGGMRGYPDNQAQGDCIKEGWFANSNHLWFSFSTKENLYRLLP